MGNSGRLILPYVLIRWGGTNLSYYPVGEGSKEPAWESVSWDLEYQSATPRLTIDFRPDVVGYAAFQECAKKVEEKITIQAGYENGTVTDIHEYYYTGMSMDSGRSQKISIEAQTITEADINSVRGNIVLNRDEEEKTLKDIVEEAKKKLKLEEDIEIEYPDNWSEKKVKQTMVIGSTFSTFLTKLAYDHGCTVQILSKGKKLVIRETPPKELEKRGVNPPEAPSGGGGSGDDKTPPSKMTGALVDSTGTTANGFLIGPGLIETVTRSATFKTTPSTPSSTDFPAVQESTSLQEKDDKKEAIARIEKPPEREKIAEDKRKKVKPKVGTGSSIKPALPKLTTEETGEGGTTSQEDKAINEAVMECKAQCEFFMVPQMVGIKPGDVFFIPSLKGDYVEDWFINKVSYTAAKGGVRVNVEGVRFPIEAGQNVVTGQDLKKFTNLSAGLNSPEKWNKYYWRS